MNVQEERERNRLINKRRKKNYPNEIQMNLRKDQLKEKETKEKKKRNKKGRMRCGCICILIHYYYYFIYFLIFFTLLIHIYSNTFRYYVMSPLYYNGQEM